MKIQNGLVKTVFAAAVLLLVVLPLSSGCGGDDEETALVMTPDTTVIPPSSMNTASSPEASPSEVIPTLTPEAENTASLSPSVIPADDTAVKFKTVNCVDHQGIGIEAFHMIIPSDWEFDSSVEWTLDNPAMPAVASFRVWNPDASEEFEGLPNLAFFWTTNEGLLMLFPQGSRYFGAEVHPPLGPIEALKTLVVPRFRQNVDNLQFVSAQLLPDVTEALGGETVSQSGISTSAEAGKIRIAYTENGVSMEEEMYCVIQSLAFPVQTMYGQVTNINWYVSYTSTFKCERGDLDSNSKVFQTVAYSVEVNPQWFSKYDQVVLYLIQKQIEQIHSIGELSRIISQTSDEISSASMQAYEQRQATNDRIVEDFSEYIRGVETYYDPLEQKTVELPSGYTNVWTNNLGEYLLSESPSFNPNIGSNLNWQQMGVNQ